MSFTYSVTARGSFRSRLSISGSGDCGTALGRWLWVTACSLRSCNTELRLAPSGRGWRGAGLALACNTDARCAGCATTAFSTAAFLVATRALAAAAGSCAMRYCWHLKVPVASKRHNATTAASSHLQFIRFRDTLLLFVRLTAGCNALLQVADLPQGSVTTKPSAPCCRAAKCPADILPLGAQRLRCASLCGLGIPDCRIILLRPDRRANCCHCYRCLAVPTHRWLSGAIEMLQCAIAHPFACRRTSQPTCTSSVAAGGLFILQFWACPEQRVDKASANGLFWQFGFQHLRG
jgi:hypothetical protein